jgi:hypothetical protein
LPVVQRSWCCFACLNAYKNHATHWTGGIGGGRATSVASRRRFCATAASVDGFEPRVRSSEIRLVSRRDVIIEQISIILGTDLFKHLLLHAAVASHS